MMHGQKNIKVIIVKIIS